jgi:hypothetical protein
MNGLSQRIGRGEIWFKKSRKVNEDEEIKKEVAFDGPPP